MEDKKSKYPMSTILHLAAMTNKERNGLKRRVLALFRRADIKANNSTRKRARR